jgi:hypothetical protein
MFDQALKECQLSLGTARKQIKDLQMQITILEMNQKKRGRNKTADRDDDLNPGTEEEQIKTLGCRYQYLVAPWINTEILLNPLPTVRPFDAARYGSPSAQREALLAEIYNLVPMSHHTSMRENPQFAAWVST